jgi:predicted HTH transcriptional regulator
MSYQPRNKPDTALRSERLALVGKRRFALSKDDDIELLADVSAFANSSGGVILYGVSEEKGEPVACLGVSPMDLDKVILRLEAVIRSNLDPTLANFRF